MDEYISKTKFEELMRKKAIDNFDLYYYEKSKHYYATMKYYHDRAIGYSLAADEAHDFPAADVQPISNNVRYDAVYGRVSTQKQCQRGDLDNQINTILAYTATRNPVNIHIYKDVGSGLNDNRKELIKLLNDIQQNKINRLFITYKDRLTRFGFNYLNEICKYHNTTIISISNEVIEKSVQEELAEDLCAIIHSFSGKLYGLRKSQLKDINTELNNIKEVDDENETG